MPASVVFDLRSFELKNENKSCSIMAKIAGKTLCYFVTHRTDMCWYIYKWEAGEQGFK